MEAASIGCLFLGGSTPGGELRLCRKCCDDQPAPDDSKTGCTSAAVGVFLPSEVNDKRELTRQIGSCLRDTEGNNTTARRAESTP